MISDDAVEQPQMSQMTQILLLGRDTRLAGISVPAFRKIQTRICDPSAASAAPSSVVICG
jgi:hypothetical protein